MGYIAFQTDKSQFSLITKNQHGMVWCSFLVRLRITFWWNIHHCDNSETVRKVQHVSALWWVGQCRCLSGEPTNEYTTNPVSEPLPVSTAVPQNNKIRNWRMVTNLTLRKNLVRINLFMNVYKLQYKFNF
jgi:hypothetical protein